MKPRYGSFPVWARAGDRLVPIIFYGLTSLVAPATASAQLCPRIDAASSITVKAELADPEINRKLGASRLKALMHKLDRNMHLSRGQPLGITVGTASAWYRAGIRYAKRQHGGYCVWLDKTEVSVGFEHMTIYIDRKYLKGSCEYAVVLEHEMNHVKINREAIEAYLPRVHEALALAIRAKPHIRVLGTLRQAREAYLLHLRQAVKPVLKHMEAERERRNGRIDTPESYRQILARCTNW